MDELLSGSRNDGIVNEQKADEKFVIRKAIEISTAIPKRESTSKPVLHSSTRDGVNSILTQLQEAKDIDTLRVCLAGLIKDATSPIDIHIPGPAQARVTKTWIESILPNFWQVSNAKERDVLLWPLKSLAGVNAITAQLRLLIDQARSKKTQIAPAQRINELSQVIDSLFNDQLVVDLWHGLESIRSTETRHDMVWKSIVNVLASGKVVAIQAETYDYLSSRNLNQERKPVTGEAYAAWLARSIVRALSECGDEAYTAVAPFMSKVFSLGYSTTIASELVNGLVVRDGDRRTVSAAQLVGLIKSCSFDTSPYRTISGGRRFLESLFDWLSSITPAGLQLDVGNSSQRVTVSHFAKLLQTLYQADTALAEYTASTLTDVSFNTRWKLEVRRAMIAALNATTGIRLAATFEKALALFGEVLFIEHAPIQQQDAMLQTLLLLAGAVHRIRPADLLVATRSAHHTQGISNRLSSSSARARWLGMTLATAISELQDGAGSKVKFGVADLETQETLDYLNLIHVKDEIGTLEGFKAFIDAIASSNSGVTRRPKEIHHKLPVINGKQTFGPERPPEPVKSKHKTVQTEIEGDRVEELSDGEDEDPHLKPYAKPDSDPEDSDEDATLVNRNKPRPPVYIRTLMEMLREGEKPDKFQLGLKHAAPLIRRKIGFGKEVSDHAEELARILANLQDPFETPNFDELRLQALIALILSDVDSIAPWLSSQALANGYSIAQRCIMLTALGLSGRELAGYKHEDAFNPALENTSFPSKKLPAQFDAIYNTNTNPSRFLEAASKSVEQSVIQPMALAAADQTTANLDAVKVRTFSSRMANERTRRKPAANDLAKIFGKDFFNPLVHAFQQQTSAYGNTSVTASEPVILGTFLKTITILLHASGPATTDFAQIRSTFWHVLLTLRMNATKDIVVMEALLFSLMTLLDISTDRQQLVQDHPQQLMETKEWTEMVFEGLSGSNVLSEGRSQEERITALCAGVITKINEIIREYQSILMGSWSEF